jgi:hypothetical protein
MAGQGTLWLSGLAHSWIWFTKSWPDANQSLVTLPSCLHGGGTGNTLPLRECTGVG